MPHSKIGEIKKWVDIGWEEGEFSFYHLFFTGQRMMFRRLLNKRWIEEKAQAQTR